jgi:hypothetical protein
MDKPTIQAFRADFAAAVKALETKYQVSLAIGSISYAETSLSTKMSVTNVSDTGEKIVDPHVLAQKEAKARFALMMTSNFQGHGNVPEVVIGKDVILGTGMTGKIIDFDSKKFKYPFIVRCADGKTYKVPADHIRSIS